MKVSLLALVALVVSSASAVLHTRGTRGFKTLSTRGHSRGHSQALGKRDNCKQKTENSLVCGNHVEYAYSSDFELLGDHECLSTSYFYLTNGATMDCQGHTLLGSILEDGHAIVVGPGGATIKNCIIMNYHEGIVVEDIPDGSEVKLTIDSCKFVNIGKGALRNSAISDYTIDLETLDTDFINVDHVLYTDGPGRFMLENSFMTGSVGGPSAAITSDSPLSDIVVKDSFITGFDRAFDVKGSIEVLDTKIIKTAKGIMAKGDVKLTNVGISYTAGNGITATPDDPLMEFKMDITAAKICGSGEKDIHLLESDFFPFNSAQLACDSATSSLFCEQACTLGMTAICAE